MADGSAQQLAVVTEAIEAYWRRNPGAADSALGITQWWLAPAGIETSVAQVTLALQGLLERGRIEFVDITKAQRVFRMRRNTAGDH